MKKFSLYILGFGIVVSAAIVGVAAAAPLDSIQYPIAELGNCKEKEVCKTYCDEPSNFSACIAYAEKAGLMSEDDVKLANKFLNSKEVGPGGCTTRDSCETYCDEMAHIDECVAYAEKTGILPPEKLEEAKQIQSAIARGVKPPACKNKKECDQYCDDPNNMKECVAFGEASGFLKGRDLEDAKKMMAAIDRGVTPLPCRGKEACDEYCSSSEHIEACITFAEEAGMMEPEEVEGAQKFLEAIKKGVKPLPCKGKEACDEYCGESEHLDECINFSVAAGFMTEQDAEMVKKSGGRGPGGCSNKDDCEAFCEQSENQETCFNYGKERGMISPEQLKEMEEGNQNFRESLNNALPEVRDCFIAVFGEDLSKVIPSRENGDKMGKCYSEHMNDNGPTIPRTDEPGGSDGPWPGDEWPRGPGRSGPGGCQGPEECDAYCQEHLDECMQNQESNSSERSSFGEPMIPRVDQGPEGGFGEGGDLGPMMLLNQEFPVNDVRQDGEMMPPEGGFEPAPMMPRDEAVPQQPPVPTSQPGVIEQPPAPAPQTSSFLGHSSIASPFQTIEMIADNLVSLFQ